MALRAKIQVDTKDVKKGLDSTKQQAEKTMTTIGKSVGKTEKAMSFIGRALDQASKGMNGLGNAAKGLLSTLGGWGVAAAGGLAVFTAAVGFAFKQFGKFKEQAKSIKVGADRSGMNVEDYSKLTYVAQQTGVSMETLTSIIDKLGDAMDKTATGNGKYLAFWNALRISLVKLNNMTPVDKINEISAAIKAFKGDLKDIPYIEEIMGKSNMQGLRDLSKFDVKGVVERGKAMGVVIDEKHVKAVMKWQRSMDSASQSTMMAVTETLNYIEALEKLSKWMLKLQKDAQPPKDSDFISYDQAYAEEVKRLAYSGGRHGKSNLRSYDEFVRAYADVSMYGLDINDPEAVKEIKKNPHKYGIGVTEDEYYSEKGLAMYNADWWARNKDLIKKNVLAKYPSFKDTPELWAMKEGDTQASASRNVIHLDTYAKSMIGKEKPRSLIELGDIDQRAELYGPAQAKYAQVQSFMDMKTKLNKLLDRQEDMSVIPDNVMRSLKKVSELKFDEINGSTIDVDALVLEAEAEVGKGLTDGAKKLLYEVAGHLKGLKLDDQKIKEIKDMYKQAVEEATDTFKLESIKRLSGYLSTIETPKVESRTYGDVTAVLKEIAESAGKSVEDYLEELKRQFSEAHPETKGMDKLKYNELFTSWLSDNLEDIATEWAQKMDEQSHVPSGNDFMSNVTKIMDRLREHTELAIRKTIQKVVEDAETALRKARNQLNPDKNETFALDFADALKALSVTEEQYNKDKRVKAAVDKLVELKQQTRELDVRAGLQADEEAYQERVDSYGMSAREADRKRSYADAAKKLGMAVADLPDTIKEEIDKQVEKRQEMREMDLGDSLKSQQDEQRYRLLEFTSGRKEAERARAYADAAKTLGVSLDDLPQKWKDKIDEVIEQRYKFEDAQQLSTELTANAQTMMRDTHVYTNDLARKGGWQNGVVVQKDDRWQTAVQNIEKITVKILAEQKQTNANTSGI